MGEGQGTRPGGQEAKSKSPDLACIVELEKWCRKRHQVFGVNRKNLTAPKMTPHAWGSAICHCLPDSHELSFHSRSLAAHFHSVFRSLLSVLVLMSVCTEHFCLDGPLTPQMQFVQKRTPKSFKPTLVRSLL